MSNIPSAPALPDNAPVTYELEDWSNPANPVVVSTINLNIKDKSFVPQDTALAQERGEAAWYRSDKPLTFGDFNFGVHLFVSHAGNTTSGTQPLVEGAIFINRGGGWNFPFASTYNKKQHSTFPKAFKIRSKDKNGNVVHVYEMRDGLPMNDPSLWQKYPTETQAHRPKVCTGMSLLYWNERPKRSALLESMFAGIVPEALRPSTAKSHYTFNGCEPQITGGYSGNSLNSLGNIYVNKQWPMPKAAYWPEDGKADPYFPYSDACYDGHSAFMGPWIEGYDYEPGSRTTHNWYSAPGGPRPDRAPFASQLALWATDPNGKRPDGVSYADIAYGYTLAYGNHPNKFVSDVTTGYLRPDDDLMRKLYFTGNYYGDGPGDSDNAIRLNGDQRDGTSDWAYDINGDMAFNGWARDSLHDYCNSGEAAILMQSPLMMVLSKFDTVTSMMLHGQWAGRGMDYDGGSYLVRDMSWKWKHIVLAWKLGADHPLGFKQSDIEAYFTEYLELIHRDIVTPMQTGNIPANCKHYFAGIARFGHPMVYQNGKWGSPAGGLGLYLGGVLAYMKQSGLWAKMQANGGKAFEAILFTVRNACQYAFGIFSQTRGDIFPYASYAENQVFSDGTDMPKDWAEFGQHYGDGTYFNGPNPDSCWGGDRDVSVHPTIQFCYVMRDYFPEIAHPWKEDALAKIDKYLKNQTDLVNSKTDNTQKRDADHTFRYPGIAPLKAPAQIGPSNPVTLPEVKETPMDQIYVPKPAVIIPAPTVDGTWELVGKEYDNINVDDNTTVRYGANGNYVYAIVSGSFQVGNAYFQCEGADRDPAYGVQKSVEKFVAAAVVDTAPQAAQNPVEPAKPVEPEQEPTPAIKAPEPVVEVPATPVAPDYAQAYVAAAKAFLEALGYKVTL